jgi:hypothetical protein
MMASLTLGMSPGLDPEMQFVDAERRRELRTFLIRTRSRLEPSEVGLPCTKRRRVPGLRRGEVAELIGVTTDWYRWFECGRPVRVSLHFVSRLIAALRLSGYEALALYRLAIPEMYLAARRFSAFATSADEGWQA